MEQVPFEVLDGLGVAGILALLVVAVIKGWLVSGADARRTQDLQAQVIEQQRELINDLIQLGGLATALTHALPPKGDGP